MSKIISPAYLELAEKGKEPEVHFCKGCGHVEETAQAMEKHIREVHQEEPIFAGVDPRYIDPIVRTEEA